MDNKLFVGNLTWGATEEDLGNYFGQFGKIAEVEVMRDRFTGRARGFAFVTYENPEEARIAVENTEGKDFQGRPLKVNIARPREDRPPREGGGRDFGDRPQGGGDRGGFRPRRSFGAPRSGGGGGFSKDRPRRDFDRGGRAGFRDRSPRGGEFGGNGGGEFGGDFNSGY
ncbi:MAG: RNA-binding protein [Puniceicoccales bacterium]|jgi:RNA recognition motif-containing protein|nr:RNA-binding protein [Puniceicoccales bacterium]